MLLVELIQDFLVKVVKAKVPYNAIYIFLWIIVNEAEFDLKLFAVVCKTVNVILRAVSMDRSLQKELERPHLLIHHIFVYVFISPRYHFLHSEFYYILITRFVIILHFCVILLLIWLKLFLRVYDTTLYHLTGKVI